MSFLVLCLRRVSAIAVVGLTTFLSWGLGVMSTIEGYVFFDPYIDTWFAPGYRPELERRIHLGQTMQEVLDILGDPLSRHQMIKKDDGSTIFYYTNDGGHDRYLGIDHRDPRHKDFAWHRFGVVFDNTGTVVGIDDGWSYD